MCRKVSSPPPSSPSPAASSPSAAAVCTDDLFTTRSVGVCSPEKKLVVPESFHHASGDLYVADAYLGLLRAPARGGLADVVTTEAAGVPTGDVCFTDSNSTYRGGTPN
uniref:Strictosidine synthase conserved region domain-containing protein n=1 Tax=Oryza barthii TaxID=65489 RepID=A0A0D3H8I0_9ORYZ